MNDSDVTTLFDDLAATIEPSSAPLNDVRHVGRRKLRVRRTFEAVGVAAAVTGITLGTVAVVSHSGDLTPPGPAANGNPEPPRTKLVHQSLPPTEQEMLGKWALMTPRGSGSIHTLEYRIPSFVLQFGRDRDGFWWGANNGCNSAAGHVRLGMDGAFSTYHNATTLRLCGGPDRGAVLDIVEHAAQVRIRTGSSIASFDDRLTFFDANGAELGVFDRVLDDLLPDHSLPGLIPTVSELYGQWLLADSAPAHDALLNPYVLDFGTRLPWQIGVVRPDDLAWWAYEGCGVRVGADALLAPDGLFSVLPASISRSSSPAGTCASRIDIVETRMLSASALRLVHGHLVFYDNDDRAIGTFALIQRSHSVPCQPGRGLPTSPAPSC